MCGTSVICSDLPYDKFSDYNHVIEVTNSMTDSRNI